MPDENKHAALEAQGFGIAPVCATCKHWRGRMGRLHRSGWGKCAKADYAHGKHLRPNQAGTPDVGTCRLHVLDLDAVDVIAGRDYTARYACADATPPGTGGGS